MEVAAELQEDTLFSTTAKESTEIHRCHLKQLLEDSKKKILSYKLVYVHVGASVELCEASLLSNSADLRSDGDTEGRKKRRERQKTAACVCVCV